MSNLKWFSGGKERSQQANILITELLNELSDDSRSEALKKVLSSYKQELNSGVSVPLILSRMNLDISNAVRKDGVALSAAQAEKLKELTALSSIRYGYY